MADYAYIERQHQLDLAITQLKNAQIIAVDTESSGYFTYFSQLCLIQISTEHYHYIIDVMNNLDLSGLARIFADPQVEKIFHAAASDILELKRAYDWQIVNVFDTLLACRLISGDSCSLAHVVEKVLDIKLEKKFQKSNWKYRPLQKSQLDYAHLDTLYLITIRQYLAKKLQELNLEEEYRFECLEMEALDKPATREYNPDSFLKLSEIEQADPQTRGRCKALFLLRDKIARQKDLAPFRLISNSVIYEISQKNPTTIAELSKIPSINPKLLHKEGQRILNAMVESQPVQDSELISQADLEPELLRKLKKLKKTRSAIAKYRGMKPALIIGNKAIMEMATQTPKDLDELRGLNLMNDWKLKFYGQLFVDSLNGVTHRVFPPGLPVLSDENRHQ